MGLNRQLTLKIEQSEKNIVIPNEKGLQPSEPEVTRVIDDANNFLDFPEELTRSETGSVHKGRIHRASRLSEPPGKIYFHKTPWEQEEADLETKQTSIFYECFFYELLRLVDKEQPPAIPILDATGNPSIATVEIPNYQTFTRLTNLYTDNPDTSLAEVEFKRLKQKFQNDTYKGLVYKLAWRWFLNDVDASTNNLGINEANNVINIDGGLAFFKLLAGPYAHSPYRHQITEYDYKNFPYIKNYKPRFWASIELYEKENRSGKILKSYSYSLIKDTTFFKEKRFEFYRAVLEFILLPPQLFQDFIARIISDIVQMNVTGGRRELLADYFNPRIHTLVDFLKQQQATLRSIHAKLNEPEFIDYLKHQGDADFARLLKNVKSYKTKDGEKIIEIMPELVSNLEANYKEIKMGKISVDRSNKTTENTSAATVTPPHISSFPSLSRKFKSVAKPVPAKNSFPWLDMIKGVGSALAMSGVVALCCILYGSLTVATLGTNLLLTVCIGLGIASVGGSIGLMCSDQVLDEKAHKTSPPVTRSPSPTVIKRLLTTNQEHLKHGKYEKVITEHVQVTTEKVTASNLQSNIQTKTLNLTELVVTSSTDTKTLGKVTDLPSPPRLGMR